MIPRGLVTGDIVNEVGRRIATSAPHVALLDSTFLRKVAPTNGPGTQCRRQYWTGMIGAGVDSTNRHRQGDSHRAGLCSWPLVLRYSGPKQQGTCLLRPVLRWFAPGRGDQCTGCLRRPSFLRTGSGGSDRRGRFRELGT